MNSNIWDIVSPINFPLWYMISPNVAFSYNAEIPLDRSSSTVLCSISSKLWVRLGMGFIVVTDELPEEKEGTFPPEWNKE